MSALVADLKFALRQMRRTPGLTAAAVLALALGIGANTAIFSVVDGVLLRPLPYREPAALLSLSGAFPVQGLDEIPLSVPEVRDLRAQARTLAAVGAFTTGDANLVGGSGAPEHVCAGVATASLFPLLGVEPVLGRNFAGGEELLGSQHVALLDYGMWQRRFAGDANVIGKTVRLDNESYTVVGVLPRGFRLEAPCDVWSPLVTNDPEVRRGMHSLGGIARIAAGHTRAQVDAELRAISARLAEQYPRNYRGGTWHLSARPLLDHVVGDARLPLLVLFAAVGFVLLIACANVANLLLARAAARGREMAIRTALGAARRRLIRQMLTEAVLLSLIGGVIGLLLAVWGVDAMVAMSPDALPRAGEVALDRRVLLFTLGLSLVAGIAFGLMPAMSASRPDLTYALKDGGRGATGARGRLRRALVVAEVALSLVLLVGMGLMLRSFLRVQAVDPGFRPDHVLSMGVSLPAVTRDDGEQTRWVSFFARAVEGLGALPGVQRAAAVNVLPFSSTSTYAMEIEGYVPTQPGDVPSAEVREVVGDYFGTLGVPLVRGRVLGAGDVEGAPRVVVVNQEMARRFWPNEDAIGRHLKLNPRIDKEWATVVGVVGDVRGYGLDQPAHAEVYAPHAQLRSSSNLCLIARTAGDPMPMAASARGVVTRIDPLQPVYDVRTMDDYVARSLAQRRFSLVLMLIFGGVALLLAAVGIYGVMSYTVAQRTSEIGIRIALGATPAAVLSMVVREGMTLVGAGLALGGVGALALTRLLASMLYGVSATDGLTYAAIAALLAGVALVAIVIPARRATRVDPMTALRAD